MPSRLPAGGLASREAFKGRSVAAGDCTRGARTAGRQGRGWTGAGPGGTRIQGMPKPRPAEAGIPCRTRPCPWQARPSSPVPPTRSRRGQHAVRPDASHARQAPPCRLLCTPRLLAPAPPCRTPAGAGRPCRPKHPPGRAARPCLSSLGRTRQAACTLRPPRHPQGALRAEAGAWRRRSGARLGRACQGTWRRALAGPAPGAPWRSRPGLSGPGAGALRRGEPACPDPGGAARLAAGTLERL